MTKLNIEEVRKTAKSFQKSQVFIGFGRFCSGVGIIIFLFKQHYLLVGILVVFAILFQILLSAGTKLVKLIDKNDLYSQMKTTEEYLKDVRGGL